MADSRTRKPDAVRAKSKRRVTPKGFHVAPPVDGRKRVIIEGVKPEIDGGRFPIKRTVGEKVSVEADVFADGHDAITCVLLFRRENDSAWTEVGMQPMVNDRWRAEFTVTSLGRYQYTLKAWVDGFRSWRRDLSKKVDAGQDVSVDLLVGAKFTEEAAHRASAADRRKLRKWARDMEAAQDLPQRVRLALALDDEVAALMSKYPDKRFATEYDKELAIVVDREIAGFSAWYEMFPRSTAAQPGRHGTLKDCEDRLPYVASMGFDVLYLPPVHPIGHTNRKGKNNTPTANSLDPGSPWAIGSEKGGHKAIHPELGTLEDFRRLVAKAREHGMEIALDIAYQGSPDHPYVREHPEWFRWRPDGSLQYAENPPKKYEDIYPFDFETEGWQALWGELKSIVLFWIEQGVRIFRVDNPHTKPLTFWEWLINEVKRDYPDVIFLSEAFTRPKVMHRLAKLGFTQSYTFFAWRNTKWELRDYFTELTQTDAREYFRPNLWPNTPDILTEQLQMGGRAIFMGRLVLAATLGANYGIYGPAFELCEDRPWKPGSEEYENSEKYDVRYWDIGSRNSLKDFITRVNGIRRENPALESNRNLRFHDVDNELLICYSKHAEDGSNVILVIVNLDPHHAQGGWVEIDLEALGLDAQRPFQVHDLLSDARYLWHGPRNYVEIDPEVVPAHILRVRHRIRTEQDFDYFM